MDTMIMQIGYQVPLYIVVGFVLGICLMAIVAQIISRKKTETVKGNLSRQIEDAKREAENIIKSAQIDSASEVMKRREVFNAETNKIRGIA